MSAYVFTFELLPIYGCCAACPYNSGPMPGHRKRNVTLNSTHWILKNTHTHLAIRASRGEGSSGLSTRSSMHVGCCWLGDWLVCMASYNNNTSSLFLSPIEFLSSWLILDRHQARKKSFPGAIMHLQARARPPHLVELEVGLAVIERQYYMLGQR